jgi:arabinofuranosyltransferase
MRNYKIIIFALSAAIFLYFVYQFRDYSIDDAFVTFKYAENVARGNGLIFNRGDTSVEGYSNFLWMLLLAGGYRIGSPTLLTAKITGIACFFLTALLWFRHFNRASEKYLWLTGCLYLATPFTAFWAVSGLESGLYALLLAGYCILVVRHSKWSVAPAALIVLSRPEGFIIAAAVILIGLLKNEERKIYWKNTGVPNIAVILTALVILTGFRVFIFGYPMPNTFYAKSELSIRGFLELSKGLLYFMPLSVLFFVGIYRLLREKDSDREIAIYSGLFIVQAAISCLASTVMNFHFRYMIAFLPFFLTVALSTLSRIKSTKIACPVLATVILSLFIPLSAARASLRQERLIIAAQDDMIKYINRHRPPPRISITDIGRIPYYTDAYYYDVWGLVSREVAHGGFNCLLEYLRFPDYFILVGYFRGKQTELRFGRERMISRVKGFPHTYYLTHVSTPEGVDSTTPGYYYLAYRLDVNALDSLIRDLESK